MSRRSDLVLSTVTAVLLLVNVSNVWRLEVHPFTDLPNHLAEATILRALTLDGESSFPFYTLHPDIQIIPNVTHAVFCALFADIELGNRIWYSLYMMLLVAVVLSLIRLVRGDLWFALLAVPLIFNFNTMWGFAGFTLAVPLSLAVFRFTCDCTRAWRAWKAPVLGLAFLILYYTHVQAMMLAVPVCALTIFLLARVSLTRRALYSLALVPAVLVFLSWRWLVPEFRPDEPWTSVLLDYYTSEYSKTIDDRLGHFLFGENLPLAPATLKEPVALLYSLPILLAFLFFIHPGNLKALVATRARRAMALLAGFVFLCYALLPNNIAGQEIIIQRLSVVLYVLLICWLSFITPRRWRRHGAVAAVIVATLFTGLWFQHFSSFDRWVSGLPWVLKGQSSSKKLAAILGDVHFRTAPSIIHYNNYHIVWNKGTATTRAIDYPAGIVRKKASDEELPRYVEWIRDAGSTEELIERYSRMDLLLVHGERQVKAVAAAGGWSLLRIRNRWALFENTRSGRPARRGGEREAQTLGYLE
jgi:hypothetical protein